MDELEFVRAKLTESHPSGEVLELAAGTGLWTQYLAARAERITVVDSSPEALELCRRKLSDVRLRIFQADLFAWEPDRQYDFVFFGFWLSHVPENQFEAFWDRVRQAVKPDGRVFFVDNLPDQTATATDQSVDQRSDRAVRRLNDGREFEIIKIFYDPVELEERLHHMGWRGSVTTSGDFFLLGDLCRLC